MESDLDQEDAQHLGFFGIIKESIHIVVSFRHIFTQITLAFVLPLSIVFLAHILISELLCGQIFDNEDQLLTTNIGSAKYTKISDILDSEYSTFFIFTILYYIFLLILSLLSTSAIVYTIASIYTAKDVTFTKVINVVPQVWKRLMVTFIWSFIIICAYNFVALILLCLIAIMDLDVGGLDLLAFLIIYLIGIVYISIVWHLASVVSVLEDLHGIQAMNKSSSLIKGNRLIASAIFVTLNSSFVIIQGSMVIAGAKDASGVPGNRVGYEIFFLFLLVVLILFGLVIQTVIYFVCKSCHHENIDKSALADHLEEYRGDYMPLKSMDVQLESVHP
ncbi:uncharacterized protein LOC124932036 [Impatiens glandulifera]|uniref:uncharacterized protein LOC124932036 n=1 Tax=Impatiens glandulifera TaxID=253017 RepID=UPI001FB1640B|nr:uncharacterized protein LOC124932036 [Impatiens glandulifera]